MNLKESMDHAASPSSSANGTSALPQRIEFHLAKRSLSSYTGTTNFKVQAPSTTNTSRAFLASSENVLDSDIRFRMAVRRIGAGLENLGNTCFLNSVLQCLTYTEPLVAYLQSGKHQNSCHVVGFCALCAIQKHVVRALQSTGRILAPKDLVSNLRRISRNFRNARQEDAHEYMVNLLESMHRCCLPSGVPSESSSAYEKSLVHRIFGGCLRSQVKCMQCSYCSDKFDPFLDLSLEIMKADSVYKALGHFTAREQLDGGERQYQCQRCNQKVRAVKQLTIHKAPFVLTIHLKRFGSHISGQKIDKRVQFAPTLNLKPFVSGSYEGDLKYTLYGVLVHAGWSTHSGHYYCFVRTSTGMWYSLDDNRVYQVSERTVLEQKAYMLFYVRDAVNNAPSKPSNASQIEKSVGNVGRNGLSSTSTAITQVFENSFGKPINPATEENRMAAALENRPSGTSITLINTNKTCEDRGVEICKDSSNKLVKADGSEVLVRNNTQSSVLSSEKAVPKEKPGLENSNTVLCQLSQHSVNLHHESSSERKDNVSASVHGSKDTVFMQHSIEDKVKNVPSSNGTCAGKCTKTDSPISVAEVSDNLSHVASGGMLKLSQKAGTSFEVIAGQIIESKSDLTRITTRPSNGSVVNASSGQNAMRKGPKLRVLSLHLGRRILYGGLLTVRKRKKHKKVGNKGRKLVAAKQLLDEDTGPSTSHMTSASGEDNLKTSHNKKTRSPPRKRSPSCTRSDMLINGSSSVKDFDGEFHKRVTLGNTAGNGGDKPLQSAENAAAAVNHWGNGKSTCLKLNVAINQVQNDATADNPARLFETTVAQWDNVDSKSSRIKNTLGGARANIGYVPDEWDEEYDRGKRKKLRVSKVEFDGPNPFQEIASLKASRSKKLKREGYNLANQPFRI